MCGGVVKCGRLPARAIDLRLEAVAHANAPLEEPADVRVSRTAPLGIGHEEAQPARGQLAGIADLTAGLRVEGSAVEHYLARIARFERLDRGTLLQQRDHVARSAQPLVAVEQCAPLERRTAGEIDSELAPLL